MEDHAFTGESRCLGESVYYRSMRQDQKLGLIWKARCIADPGAKVSEQKFAILVRNIAIPVV